MTGPDYATIARSALGGATTAEDPLTVAFYLSAARIAFVKAKEDLAAVEHVLVAREREAAMRAVPKQLAIESEKSK